MPPTLADLVAAERAGVPLDAVFFWNPEPDATPGPGCLSQWWPAPFTVDGSRFATAEHYMMWRKARLFDDDATAVAILADPDPAAAKAHGRRVAGFTAEAWSGHRVEVVVAGNRAKFAQHDDLRRYLLGTGDLVLVEASPVDRIWGIGRAADDPDARCPSRWTGVNLLGFALMRVRAELA